MKRIVVMLSVMAVALALSAGPAISQATTEHLAYTFPVEATLTNPCNGEEVLFTGTVSHVQQNTTDNAGGNHLTSHNIVIKGKGTGLTSGEKYIVTTASNSSPQDPAGGTQTAGGTETVNFISTGGGDNFQARFTVRETMNANGEFTAQIYKFSTRCTG
jgi:hypothetical protein